jgi:DNA-binding MarR family transcriptional regulator
MSRTLPEVVPRWLDAEEERAWRAFRRMMVTVQARLARDLAEVGLSEADYEVLSTLSEVPDRTSTLHAQAAKMSWSRSRLSRHASRMEARGLIERRPDPTDGRGCLLVLIPQGFDTLSEAAPTHVASVRRHVIDRLTRQDLAELERISDRLQASEDT